MKIYPEGTTMASDTERRRTVFPAALAVILAWSLLVGGAVTPIGAEAQTVAFTPVTVVNVREGVVLPDMTVVVTNGRITAVGPEGSVQVPSSARVVDGTGKYLIPGLWDMHAHTVSDRITRETFLPVYVANGVTGMRDMHADCFEPCDEDRSTIEQVRRWSRDIAAGRLVGPRIVAASPELNGPPPGEPSSVHEPATEADARALVGVLEGRGVDLIKIYSMLPREPYFALAEEANRRGIPFGGHVPWAVRASEASEAGQRSMEHLMGIIEECSAREEELRPRLLSDLRTDGPHPLHTVLLMLESFSEEKCEKLYTRFIRNETWHVPTLALAAEFVRLAGSPWREDPRLDYVTPEERAYWAGRAREDAAAWPDGAASAEAMYEKMRAIVAAMHEAGVPILAGSDAAMPFMFPGFSLHDELELLVGAGLTEAEALRAATLQPARYLEATDSLGTVEAGKLADLVLLDANPLADITNAREIAAVVVDGRYLNRKALDQLLASAEQVASRPQEAAPNGRSNKDLSPANELQSDTVHVAPPTGEKETDRASILAALGEIEPGGTVQFTAGTYLVGEFLRVEVPRITLQGHPGGTTLRGCDPSAFDDRDFAVAECNGLSLTGGHQTVRDLTFEYTWHGLILGGPACQEGDCPPQTLPVDGRTGGYVVERNTFRASQNGIRVVGQWQAPAVIRDNRFLDTYHAVVVNGMTAHVVDNHVSVSEPERVPNTRHPGGALLIGGWEAPGVPACHRNVIAGNRIAGHPDAIAITVNAGGACRGNVIRGNTIEMFRVRFESASTAIHVRRTADSTVAGVPLALLNGVLGVGDGVIEGTLIEGNRITGAEGLAIEVFGASGNRIVGNTIIRVTRRDPFPGNTLFPEPPEWGAANGSRIWVSSGSEENEIDGNTFEDLAAAAVFLEGAGNRVELGSASDSVRDLGTGNRVTVQAGGTVPDSAGSRQDR